MEGCKQSVSGQWTSITETALASHLHSPWKYFIFCILNVFSFLHSNVTTAVILLLWHFAAMPVRVLSNLGNCLFVAF